MKKHKLRGVVPVAFISFLAMAAPGFSQDQRVEINPFFGYSFADGVTVNPIVIGGEIYDAVNITDGVVFGIHFGVFATENVEIGFLWARQDSALEVEGTATTELAMMPVTNYHAVFTYNFGDSAAPARPFVFGSSSFRAG